MLDTTAEILICRSHPAARVFGVGYSAQGAGLALRRLRLPGEVERQFVLFAAPFDIAEWEIEVTP